MSQMDVEELKEMIEKLQKQVDQLERRGASLERYIRNVQTSLARAGVRVPHVPANFKM
jgi:prefoldin subunit 5